MTPDTLNPEVFALLDAIMSIPAIYLAPFGVAIFVIIQALKSFQKEGEEHITRFAIPLSLGLGFLSAFGLIIALAPEAGWLLQLLSAFVLGPTIAAMASGTYSFKPATKAEAKREAEEEGLEVVEQPKVGQEIRPVPVEESKVVTESEAIDIVKGMGLDVK
jgi:hypothetical protein